MSEADIVRAVTYATMFAAEFQKALDASDGLAREEQALRMVDVGRCERVAEAAVEKASEALR